MYMKSLVLLALTLFVSKISTEYCYYRHGKESNGSYIECELAGTGEPIEGISLMHLERNTTISILKKELLAPFPNLKTLFMTAANIRKIEPDAFTNLTLVMVDLYNNKLEVLRRGTFSGQKKISYMDLSYNYFKNLTAATFSGLIGLEWLSLNANQIGLIESSALNDLVKLKSLYLRYNKISNLHVDTFKKLTALEVLDLSMNNLKTISAGLLSNQEQLYTLLLDFNALENIADGAFDKTITLTYLDVSNNRLKELPEDLFNNTKKLEVLRASNNQIRAFNYTVLLSKTSFLREVLLYNNS